MLILLNGAGPLGSSSSFRGDLARRFQGQSAGASPNRTTSPDTSIRTGSRSESSSAPTRTSTVRAPAGTAAVHCRDLASIQSSPATLVTVAVHDDPTRITRPEPGFLEAAG